MYTVNKDGSNISDSFCPFFIFILCGQLIDQLFFTRLLVSSSLHELRLAVHLEPGNVILVLPPSPIW